ncbi:MAG: hypothetical protein IKF19_04495 [Bacilli bacterium]|nr:hypothetical protein [Bacilli bacterium]
MDDYKVADISKDLEYKVIGIKLSNNKTCVYWTNKSVKKIMEVIVIFNNKNSVSLTDNQICISLNGINDIETQQKFLKIFCEQLRAIGVDYKSVTFNFIGVDEKDMKRATDLIESLGINGGILNSKGGNKKARGAKEAQINKKIEEKFNRSSELVSDSDISNIVKYDNGVRKNIVAKGNMAYDMTNSSLSMEGLITGKSRELLENPDVSKNMSEEKIIDESFRLVTGANKEYRMTNGLRSDRNNMTNFEQATADVTNKYGGYGNTELGITRNDSSFTEHRFSSIEKEDDDRVKVVSPEASSVGMKGNGKSINSNSDYIDSMNIDNNSMEVNKMDEEGRKEENNILYYVDRDGNVYEGQNGELKPGYYRGEENKIFDADGNYKGENNGNLDDMNANMGKENEKKKAKVYTYKPPRKSPYRTSDNVEKSAAFISLPVIIFIISLLLLIGSGIIWFITK